VTAADDGAATPRRIGRPRKREAPADTNPREDILAAAAVLFAELGYAGASTRRIAELAGLEQASMFHYFARKRDILSELLDRTLEPATSFSRKLTRVAAPPAESLALLAYRDTLAICSGPHDLARLMYLPEASSPEFRGYWQKRERLKKAYRAFIEAGVEAGVFVDEDPSTLTDLAFGLVESSSFWFRRGEAEAHETAARVARGVMRLTLSRPGGAEKVLARALEKLPTPTAVAQPNTSRLP
jgi:AcrR family transcriptional regulator